MGPYRYHDRWKWFLPASRSSLNPPGPPGKAKSLSFRTRNFREQIRKKNIIFLINLCLRALFWGTPRADGPNTVNKLRLHHMFSISLTPGPSQLVVYTLGHGESEFAVENSGGQNRYNLRKNKDTHVALSWFLMLVLSFSAFFLGLL